jgi:CRISPR-associated protein Cmr2
MSYLLLISLGPVQDFIASARRSRDLWFGSYLLAELSKCVARSIAAYDLPVQPGVDEKSLLDQLTEDEMKKRFERLIFPSPRTVKDLERWDRTGFNVVNVILSNVTDPAAVAKQAHKAAIAFLKGAAEGVFEPPVSDPTKPAKVSLQTEQKTWAYQQIADLLEFYWASVPLGSDYKAARDRVYDLLIARKVTRDFQAVGSWAGHVPKSSLDGLRESVIPEDAFKKPWEIWTLEDELTLYYTYGVRPGERLCGVGLLKRHGQRREKEGEEGFMSTSHVAALPLLERMKFVYEKMDEPGQQTIRTLRDAFVQQVVAGREETGLPESDDLVVGGKIKGSLPGTQHPVLSSAKDQNFDGRILFRDRLRDYFDQDQLEAPQKALEAFLKQATGLNLPGQKLEPVKNPHPYYALVHADGDRMSDALARVTDIKTHRTFSRALADFASAVRGIVERHGGGLVYAGGEDILAFLPLHKALSCVTALAHRFEDGLRAFSSDHGSPTLSVGLVIAHHLEPLSDVLHWAREAEKAAKNTYGRNALAVTLAKRGGGNVTVGDHWSERKPDPQDPTQWIVDETAVGLEARLQLFTDLHRLEAIPDGAAFDLLEIARDLESIGLHEAAKLEALRVLERKRTRDGSEMQPHVLEEIKRHLERALTPGQAHVGLAGLANELIVARVFAEVEDLALVARPEHRLKPAALVGVGS